MAGPAALIGVDWGTSGFRAFLLDAAGAIIDRRAGPHGIMSVADGDFGSVLSARIGDWMEPGLPVLMSGMIGSRQGWIEAPYVACPAALADLAAGLTSVTLDDFDIRIVPGVETASATMRDVMRGEETQIFGALANLGVDAGKFLLPGTHSKWVVVAGGRIAEFSTYMTGEIFAACRDHTILGRLMAKGAPGAGAFAGGVREGARAGKPGALLNRLFGVRTAGLFGDIAETDLVDYLSGLLIGAELADAGEGGAGPVRIVAADALAKRYRIAAAELGMAASLVDPDCVVAGHLGIARLAGLATATGRQ